MKKANWVAAGLSTVGLIFILVAMLLLDGNSLSLMSASSSTAVLSDTTEVSSGNSSTVVNSSAVQKMSVLVKEDRDIASAESLRKEVYDGLTLDELAARLNRNLGSQALAGKGELVASYCLEKGVDPYLATAIMILETGYGSSYLVKTCNNVAGQKGSPACMGSYKGYASIDDGIRGAIDNLYKNYYAHGLNTVEAIGPKYADSDTWVSKVNSFINKIRNN